MVRQRFRDESINCVCPPLEDKRYKGYRTREIIYDPKDKDDIEIMQAVEELINSMQPSCFNCTHSCRAEVEHWDQYVYAKRNALLCDIYGEIDSYYNPHHMYQNGWDGRKCEDYERNEKHHLPSFFN